MFVEGQQGSTVINLWKSHLGGAVLSVSKAELPYSSERTMYDVNGQL